MAIDIQKALEAEIDAGEFTWTPDKHILYALGVGVGINESQVDQKKVLQYTYEKELKALPTFGALFSIPVVESLFTVPAFNFNPMMLLHGEQYTEIIERPMPIDAKVKVTGKVPAIYDKVKGALIEIDSDIKDSSTDKLLVKNNIMLFVRGEGGFGKPDDPKSPAPGNEPPDREPDSVIEYPTMTQQALLYRLSGDKNPLHCDPDMAKMGNFDIPILHGLCTFGNVGRAVIEAYADHDPTRFKSIKSRFSSPVFPGETIVVQMWKEDAANIICKARVKERDVDVLTNAKVVLFE